MPSSSSIESPLIDFLLTYPVSPSDESDPEVSDPLLEGGGEQDDALPGDGFRFSSSCRMQWMQSFQKDSVKEEADEEVVGAEREELAGPDDLRINIFHFGISNRPSDARGFRFSSLPAIC